jgi:hypothetical protein
MLGGVQYSGRCLLRGRGRERRVMGVAPSYAGFLELAGGCQAEWRKPPCGAPDVGQILEAAKSLAGAS